MERKTKRDEIRKMAEEFVEANKAAEAAENALVPYQKALLELQQEYGYVGLTDAIANTKSARFQAKQAYVIAQTQFVIGLVKETFLANPNATEAVKHWLQEVWQIDIKARRYEGKEDFLGQFLIFAERVENEEFLKKHFPRVVEKSGESGESKMWVSHNSILPAPIAGEYHGLISMGIPVRLLENLDLFWGEIENKTAEISGIGNN